MAKMNIVVFLCINAKNIDNWNYLNAFAHEVLEHHMPEQIEKWKQQHFKEGWHLLMTFEARVEKPTKAQVTPAAMAGFEKEIADLSVSMMHVQDEKNKFLAISHNGKHDDDIIEDIPF